MKFSYNKLLLSWKGPSTGRNYPVGILEKNKGLYLFYYNKDILLDAKSEGFTPLIGLSDLDSSYESKKMFSVFERRLPNANRNSFKNLLAEFDLHKSDDILWNYLWLTGGKLATDSLSFVTPVVYIDGYIRFATEVAGWSYTKNNNRELVPEDELLVRVDKTNKKDAYAVELLDRKNSNCKVGYIPRPFNLLLYRLLQKNITLLSNVFHVSRDEKRPRILVYSIEFPKNILKQESDLQYLIDYQ